MYVIVMMIFSHWVSSYNITITAAAVAANGDNDIMMTLKNLVLMSIVAYIDLSCMRYSRMVSN